MDTPYSYAARLATYIASPLKIEKLVALEFDEVPPLHEIAELRYKVERENKAFRRSYFVKDKPDHDGDHFAVRPIRTRRKPRTYTNSRTVYVPAHVDVIEGFDQQLQVRSHCDVVSAAAKAFGLTYADVVGRKRHTKYVCARTVAARILRDRGNSYPQIGRYLGGRDHSTAINLVERFDSRARRHPEVREVYERLTKAVAE